MIDQRFYDRKGPFSIAELARVGGCTLSRGEEGTVISDVSPLDTAEPTTISVLHNAKYVDALQGSLASAVIMSAEYVDKAPLDKAILVSESPYRSYALIASHFYPDQKSDGYIHPAASIDETASLGRGCQIGAFAVIGKRVVIGEGVSVGAHTVIGDDSEIGDGCSIDPHVTITHTIMGKNVTVKAGARLGQKGFGFFMDEKGHVSVPQLGRLIIHDHAEIGANSTVDRGSGKDTIIGQGTRIDNLVQVAHNVEFGKGCVMVAQSGVSGSTKFGDYVAAGGQVGIIDHLKIGTGARLAAQSGIMSDVEPGAVLCGSPAVPIKTFYRQVAVLQRVTRDFAKLLKFK